MLNPAAVYYILGSAMAVGGLFVRWLAARDKDQEDRFDAKIKAAVKTADDLKDQHTIDVTAIKATQKLLFEKNDATARELQNYRLYVAETYVNQAALETMLHPIERRLEAIENDLRGDHRVRA